MSDPASLTADLLQRFHGGDLEALRSLLARHLPWLRDEVHRRLGPSLRKRADADDFVHDAALNVLRYAPHFVVHDESHFRALLARIVVNSIKDKNRWFTARRRRMAEERPLPSESAIDLTGRGRSATSPSQAAVRSEREAWVRLGVELLEESDREVIVMREWDDLAFSEIAARIGVQEDAARMRYVRAVRRLGDLVTKLRRDGVESALAAREGDASPDGGAETP